MLTQTATRQRRCPYRCSAAARARVAVLLFRACGGRRRVATWRSRGRGAARARHVHAAPQMAIGGDAGPWVARGSFRVTERGERRGSGLRRLEGRRHRRPEGQRLSATGGATASAAPEIWSTGPRTDLPSPVSNGSFGSTSGENEGSKKVKKKIKKKGNLCGFKSRFNSKRLAEIGKQVSPEKRRIIRQGPFGDLLDIRSFKVPHELIEFVVMNTNHILSEFKHKNKSITFSKLMVKRIFNVPSGDRPMKLLKKSDEHDLRSIYKEGNRAPIAHVVKLLTSCSDEDVVMINRTWTLLALATVLCPGTGNMVNLEYLASLEDMSLVHEFAWDEHLLARAMEEVGVFQEKKRMQANTEKAAEFQIASCLPMLAIIYMDHIDIPPGLPNEHAIDYSVPRIRFVCQKDFDWLDKVDKNKLTLVQPFYGKHTQIRSLCNTPYAAQLMGQEVGAEAASGQGVGAKAPSGQGSQIQGADIQAKDSQSNEAQQNVDVEPHLSSSLNDWLQQSFPSMQDLRVPTQFQMLYDKHKGIFAAEVDGVAGKFGQCLKGLQCNRMAALLRDVGDAITATNEPNFSFEAPIMDECRRKENDAKAANADIGAQAQAQGTTPSINKDEVTGLNLEVATEAAETREQQRVSFEMEGNASL
ncbi:uncharacterized protein [Triticum aestivum]|uniref:uncharacterized protein n=1 Tax=Triticum aestivum TaxID=4565 RepID=UPI001D0329E1|nr:uncharacterized protein LOC123076588 [Triticum aestivum]